jgi:two-component system, OmpR family, sensor kinase
VVGAVPGLSVIGDRALLARALDNLLGNAIKFAPPGQPVELQAWRENGHAVIAVRDRGPGVPAAELDKIFRPFFRGANAAVAEGQGLGLPIVDRIARAHGGSITAANRAGGGFEQTLRLPLGPGG